jgi:hypothetical protein
MKTFFRSIEDRAERLRITYRKDLRGKLVSMPSIYLEYTREGLRLRISM